MSNVQIQRGGNPVPVAPVFASTTEEVSTTKTIPLQTTLIGPPVHAGSLVVLLASAPSTSHVALATNAGPNVNATGLFDGKGGLVYAGPLTLTTAQWDARTGDSGGLVTDQSYFLDTGGNLTSTPPTASGTYVALVGTAATPETMNVTLLAANGPHA